MVKMIPFSMNQFIWSPHIQLHSVVFQRPLLTSSNT